VRENVSHDISGIGEKEDIQMIQSIQAGSTSIYNPTKSTLMAGKITTDAAEANQAAVQNEDENTEVSSQGDILTISSAGAQAAKTFTAQSANRPSVNGTSEDTYTDATAAAFSTAASGVGITDTTIAKSEAAADSAAVSGSSSSSSSDSNLSEYSEAELKEMLENGEITQAEYEAEIQSRSQSSISSDEESEADSVVKTGETDA
jgi:hypothetical protein